MNTEEDEEAEAFSAIFLFSVESLVAVQNGKMRNGNPCISEPVNLNLQHICSISFSRSLCVLFKHYLEAICSLRYVTVSTPHHHATGSFCSLF